ncbi:protein of unknown function [Catalinimonas alkaloidigena]|uniref:3-keto-alpha-glucoside-1,2-lyase/3-keto-2-hydroxy-glucal hydratase domain-containing protein n=1 Tax=Catalinimonas alkaloidigena TaxID=1075417 RepID=A0A1G8X4C8_9BACT|nr:DUF1080 domain-containing protein [Catalinimonas alkaloidigena]SDJ84695.1 protein of unknown function [Catalinimonas alkaloidigena]
MKKILFPCFLFLISCGIVTAQVPPQKHPDTGQPGWKPLFQPDLSDAAYPTGIWRMEKGVLTATEDLNIWSNRPYDNFIIDLEFKTADGTNSGVVVYCSDTANWIPNSIEVQIADDYSEEWSKADPSWQCGAFFGHKAPTQSAVKKPGKWNKYTITCQDNRIWILLNGQQVNEIDLTQWTSGSKTPDGKDIPSWLNKPWATLPTRGYIGFQGKHAGAPIYFRNIMIKELP